MKAGAVRILLILLGIGLGLFISRNSWQHYFEQRQAAEDSRRAMQAAEAKRAELTRQKADLGSEAGREREARDQGWMRPGERQF